MRLRQYDPVNNLSYSHLVAEFLTRFRDLHRPEEIIDDLGSDRVTDITDKPEMGEASVKLLSGAQHRIYQFKESENRGGFIDAVFQDGRLINFRARMFFDGWFGKAIASIFARTQLSPLLARLAGKENMNYDDESRRYFCHLGDLVLAAGWQEEFNLPSVSIWMFERDECLKSMLSLGDVRHYIFAPTMPSPARIF